MKETKKMDEKVEICEEMKKLRTWLNENHIHWQDWSDCYICRTRFQVNWYRFSVLHGFGTYGGKTLYLDEISDQKLLECRVSNYEPEGWLTAEDVIKLIEEYQK